MKGHNMTSSAKHLDLVAFRSWLRAGIDECESELGRYPASRWSEPGCMYLQGRERMLAEALSALTEWESMPVPIRPGVMA
jgi:hypothetical protein